MTDRSFNHEIRTNQRRTTYLASRPPKINHTGGRACNCNWHHPSMWRCGYVLASVSSVCENRFCVSVRAQAALNRGQNESHSAASRVALRLNAQTNSTTASRDAVLHTADAFLCMYTHSRREPVAMCRRPISPHTRLIRTPFSFVYASFFVCVVPSVFRG